MKTADSAPDLWWIKPLSAPTTARRFAVTWLISRFPSGRWVECGKSMRTLANHQSRRTA